MKKSFSIFTLLLFSSCTQPNFTLDMTIADGHDFNGHQAFLLGYYDTNSAIWLDSVRVMDNQAKFRIKMPYAEMLCEVIIEDCPTSFQQFRFAQGERASFVFDPNLQTLYPPVEGSVGSEEVIVYWNEISAGLKKQRELRMTLATADAGSSRSKELEQELKEGSANMRLRSIDLLSNTKSLINAFLAYNMLFDLPADSLAKIKNEMLCRWSDDVNRSLLTGVSSITGDSIGDMTLQTKVVLNRRAILMGDLPPYPVESHTQTNTPEPETEIYALNDVVADISLPDKTGNDVALSSLTTPYVLVDFWASWCAPCREEMPVLRATVRDYKETLSVYAVSIDDNLNHWKQAIDSDGSWAALTHVVLRKDNSNYDRLFRLFGIETIPHNFLLDADGRIVAVDLRGEALRMKLEELERK